MATVPNNNMTFMTFSSPGSVTMTTPPTTDASVPGMTFSSPGSATFTAPTPSVASPNPIVIACIAALGVAIFVLGGVAVLCTYHYYRRRSSTDAGRNHPMSEHPDGRLWTERSLSTTPQNDYQPLPVRQENITLQPASPQSHYQTIPVRQENITSQPASPQSHYQTIPVRQENITSQPASPQSHYQTIPVRQENITSQPASPQSHYQTIPVRQENTATGGSNPMVNTGRESDQQRPDHPVYMNLLTE